MLTIYIVSGSFDGGEYGSFEDQCYPCGGQNRLDTQFLQIDQRPYLPLNALTILRFADGLPLVKIPSGFLLGRRIVLAFSKCPDLPVHRELLTTTSHEYDHYVRGDQPS